MSHFFLQSIPCLLPLQVVLIQMANLSAIESSLFSRIRLVTPCACKSHCLTAIAFESKTAYGIVTVASYITFAVHTPSTKISTAPRVP